MNIPQEELDKLGDSTEGLFEEHKEEEVEEAKPDEVVEEKVSVSPEEDTVADKARIPYSRFETVNEEKIRAQERVKYLEEQLASKSLKSAETPDTELPPEWVELYGDSDAAKRAYALQMSINDRIQEQAALKAIERIESRKQEQEKAVAENVETINRELASFSEKLGRKLSDTEENAILDVQDEFTQKDKDGNYITPLFPADKAFEILTLRQEKANASKKQAKTRVLQATNGESEGDVSVGSGADYNPLGWGSWRSKL